MLCGAETHPPEVVRRSTSIPTARLHFVLQCGTNSPPKAYTVIHIGLPMSKSLGEFEQAILFALLELEEDDAYGVRIREAIEARTGRTISSGAVYTALDRMEDRGLVESKVGEPTATRGGRRKRMYRLNPSGSEALLRSVRHFQQISSGLLPLLEAHTGFTGSDGSGG